MAGPAYSGVPATYLRSTSGYITTSPGLLDSVVVTGGSTAGTYTFRDGSTTGAIKLIVPHAAGAPGRSVMASPQLGQGIHFTSKIYMVKAGSGSGANKGLVQGGYKKYIS